MSWLKLKRPMDEASNADTGDIVNAKRALLQLGYYQPPEGGALGAWVDNQLFEGIRRFQRDNRLKVDGVMRPGGPTEATMNRRLAGRDGSGGPINAKGLLDQFNRYMSPEFYDDPRDGKCRATGTCENSY